MTLEQFDLDFDILFNSISSNVAPSLTPLEKSILLTQAQELVVKEYYNGGLAGNSFEKNEESKEYLNTLIKQEPAVIINIDTDDSAFPCRITKYKLPEEVLYIVNEYITTTDFCGGSKILKVKPSSNDEYLKSLDNPFSGPIGDVVLRRIENNIIYLYSPSSAKIQKYFITYIRRPDPIVLTGITEAPEPYSKYKETGNNCSLPESCHQDVLMKAVQLAKSVWASQ